MCVRNVETCVCVYSCSGSIKEQEMTANFVLGVLPLQGSPLISRPEIWRSRSLFYLVPDGHILVRLLLGH